VAHAPVQVEEVALSPAWVYSVIPVGPVRTMPKVGELGVDGDAGGAGGTASNWGRLAPGTGRGVGRRRKE
jgi:hypothetical protein